MRVTPEGERRGRLRMALRIELNLTRGALATKAGITSQTVRVAESGRGMHENTIRKIADALGIRAVTYFDP